MPADTPCFGCRSGLANGKAELRTAQLKLLTAQPIGQDHAHEAYGLPRQAGESSRNRQLPDAVHSEALLGMSWSGTPDPAL